MPAMLLTAAPAFADTAFSQVDGVAFFGGSLFGGSPVSLSGYLALPVSTHLRGA